jgi:hypothetical protein
MVATRRIDAAPAWLCRLSCLGVLALAGPAGAEEAGAAHSGMTADHEAMIAQALSAAPPQIAATATVKDMEGHVLREGSGSYTCFPAPHGIAGPMCMDGPWLAWMDAWMNGKPTHTTEIGVAYMLAGDSPDGGASNIDPAATSPTMDNEWVVEGPHVMIIVPDPAILAGLPTTMEADGPYVMWSGTPYAHIMAPTDRRPDQRQASAE